MALRLWVLCIGMLMLSVVQLQGSDLQAKETPEAPMLAAFAAVYHDFAKRIASENAQSDLARHLTDITNYRLTTYQRDKRFVVEIVPLPLEERTLRGGGGKYEVDAKTIEILRFEPYR